MDVYNDIKPLPHPHTCFNPLLGSSWWTSSQLSHLRAQVTNSNVQRSWAGHVSKTRANEGWVWANTRMPVSLETTSAQLQHLGPHKNYDKRKILHFVKRRQTLKIFVKSSLVLKYCRPYKKTTTFVFPYKIQMPLEELVINFSLGISARCP